MILPRDFSTEPTRSSRTTSMLWSARSFSNEARMISGELPSVVSNGLVMPPVAAGFGQSSSGLMPAPRMPPTQRDGSTITTVRPARFTADAAMIPEGVAP